MIRFFAPVVILTLFLNACTPGGLSSQGIPSSATAASTAVIDQPTSGFSTVAPSGPQGCGYQWANQGLPGLSKEFQKSLQLLQPEAQANAFVFGESCVYQDGSSVFLPMETDFSVTLQVRDLSDDSELGEWIVRVMEVVEAIPSDQIVGPRPGRVNLVFHSNGQEERINFSIDRYRILSPNLSSAEVYQALLFPR